MVALGLDGCVEQFALRMSPGSYLVNSVQSVGGKLGNSVNDEENYFLSDLLWIKNF